MEYVINVAKKEGNRFVHYFKVTVPYGNVKKVYNELVEKFPNCKIEVTKWEKIGRVVDLENCDF